MMSEIGEQAALAHHEPQEVRRGAADAGRLENRVERLLLHVGGEHGAAHQAFEVGALVEQALEFCEVGADLVDGIGFERQLEQCGRIASCHSGNRRIFPCHGALLFGSAQSRRDTVPG